MFESHLNLAFLPGLVEEASPRFPAVADANSFRLPRRSTASRLGQAGHRSTTKVQSMPESRRRLTTR